MSASETTGATGGSGGSVATGVTRVTLLGSTGSIGTQGLQVIAAHPERFEVSALAGGGNIALLAEQAVAFTPALVAAAFGSAAELTAAIGEAAVAAGRGGYAPEVIVGPQAATEVAAVPTDVVLNGMTGAIGLRPTLAALASGARLALTAAMELARRGGGRAAVSLCGGGGQGEALLLMR